MKTTIKTTPTVTILEIHQELTAQYAESLKSVYADRLANVDNVLVDLSNLEYIDSTGLGALIFCLKKSQANGGQFVVAGLNEEPALVFEIMRATQIFTIYPTVEDALPFFN